MSDTKRPLGGQKVLVTRASGGIGAAIVEQLAIEGARPVNRIHVVEIHLALAAPIAIKI